MRAEPRLAGFRAAGAVAMALFLAAPAAAGRKPPEPPDLSLEHVHPSGRFSFKTPHDWKAGPSPTRPEAFDASGGGGTLLIRFIYRSGEVGYDSLHADCMLDRLAGPMDTSPSVKYEYDFVGGTILGRRALDSAFVVRYDNAIQGHRDWRQRNLTIVGAGESLCLVTYVPVEMWKKPETRTLMDAVLNSLTFKKR